MKKNINKNMSTITKVAIGIVAIMVLWFGYQYMSQSELTMEFRSPQDTSPVTIGFIGALTGDAASYGNPMRNGVEMAVDEINAAGGINGRELRVIYEDGKCVTKDAVEAAYKLVNVDKVKVIIGGVCSSETQAILAVTEGEKVIVFSPSASSPNLTGAGRYFFRSSPSDAAGGSFLANMILKKYKKISTIAEETEYALALERVLEERFAKSGGTILNSERFAPGTTDFSDSIARIKATNPEAIFVNPQGDAGALIIKQIKAAGITVPLYGTNVLSSEEVIKAAGEAIEGLIFFDNPELDHSDPKTMAFLEEYERRYGHLNIEYYTGTSYDSVYILAGAIAEVGSEDTEAIRKYLDDLKGYDGVAGKQEFDENGDITGISHVKKQIKNGQVITIRD